jgi:hypothetical protein
VVVPEVLGDKAVEGVMERISEILQAARDRISLPEHWTKTAYARDANGSNCHPKALCAHSFCAHGTIVACEASHSNICESLLLLRSSIGVGLLSNWNDEQTHAEVLAGFDKAIREATAAGV